MNKNIFFNVLFILEAFAEANLSVIQTKSRNFDRIVVIFTYDKYQRNKVRLYEAEIMTADR